MSYKDAKIRLCPKCRKNVRECKCYNQAIEQSKPQNKQKQKQQKN